MACIKVKEREIGDGNGVRNGGGHSGALIGNKWNQHKKANNKQKGIT